MTDEYRLLATWADGRRFAARVRRFPWWLKWWPSRNVTFGSVILEGGPVGMNPPTMRHELTHVRQYAERGWGWVWLHPIARENEAHAAERSVWPTFVMVMG